MPSHISDSLIYGGSWGTAETRALFDDEPRTRSWLRILAVLAESQAEVELIPKEAAGRRRAHLPRAPARTMPSRRGPGGLRGNEPYDARAHPDRPETLPGNERRVAVLRRQPFRTSRILDDARPSNPIGHREARARSDREPAPYARQETSRHRHARTDPRPAPASPHFRIQSGGLAREFLRHLQRLKEMQSRLGVGQLCGGLGSLSSLGPRGFELQESFFGRLGLRPPDISWIVAPRRPRRVVPLDEPCFGARRTSWATKSITCNRGRSVK